MKKLFAKMFGYFWLQCPICYEYFGGFESSKYSLIVSENKSRCVCKKCGPTAIALNAITYSRIPVKSKITFNHFLDTSGKNLKESKIQKIILEYIN